MTLHVEQNYAAGIPQTAVVGFDPRGLAWHWTAGGTGRAGAESTIRHFINTRGTVNASYHILLWFEAATKRTYAMWIVRPTVAAHSLAPANAFKVKTGSARELQRFTEVRRILGAKAGDPNAGCIAISFCGMPADLAAAMKDPVFRADVRELARQLIEHPRVIDRPHFGHGWIQPITRYETDVTTGGADILIAQLYGSEAAPAPTPSGGNDMIPRNPVVTQEWDTVPGEASTFTRPDGTTGWFTDKERVKTVLEGTVSGKDARVIDYGPDHEALVIMRGGLTNPGTRIVGSPTATTTVVTKEVIKEVPTGITEAEVQAAQEEAATAERNRIAAAEAQRASERIKGT